MLFEDGSGVGCASERIECVTVRSTKSMRRGQVGGVQQQIPDDSGGAQKVSSLPTRCECGIMELP